MVIKILNLAKCIKKFGDLANIDITPEIVEGTRKVQRRAKDLAPINKNPSAPTRGNLRASIKTKIVKANAQNAFTYGIVYTNVEYAIYQEFGTSGHTVVPVTKKALYWEGAEHPVKRVEIPPMKPQPFMLPAINIERLGINSSMAKYLREKMAKIASK